LSLREESIGINRLKHAAVLAKNERRTPGAERLFQGVVMNERRKFSILKVLVLGCVFVAAAGRKAGMIRKGRT
jgi:hypothetical protein